MSWWETLHLVTWWKRLGISAIKTGQDAPSWIWCTERLSFFGGGHIVLQRFVHVRCHFQPLPTKLVFAYFDRGSYIFYRHQDEISRWPQMQSKEFHGCFKAHRFSKQARQLTNQPWSHWGSLGILWIVSATISSSTGCSISMMYLPGRQVPQLFSHANCNPSSEYIPTSFPIWR